MLVQRPCNKHLQPRVRLRDRLNNAGQVAVHVQAQSQEIREDDDPVDSGCGKPAGSSFQAGISEFKEGGNNVGVAGCNSKIGCYGPHRLVGGLDPRAVGEDDYTRPHEAVEMYARMWCSSSVFRASS